MKGSLKNRDRARIARSVSSTKSTLAREKSRHKPEDVLYRSFSSAIIVAILAFFSKVKRFFGLSKKAAKHRTHARGFTLGNGFGKRQGHPGSKLWHRLSVGHSSSAGWPSRKIRKYAARGYGYVTPNPPRRTWIPAKESGY